MPDRIRFLRPRDYSVGRAGQNDICVNEPSISKPDALLEQFPSNVDVSASDPGEGSDVATITAQEELRFEVSRHGGRVVTL